MPLLSWRALPLAGLSLVPRGGARDKDTGQRFRQSDTRKSSEEEAEMPGGELA